jgi:hypothetical protein
MLDVKYVIQTTKKEKNFQLQSNANGNAWFVSQVQLVNSADEMKALDSLDSKNVAVVNSKRF